MASQENKQFALGGHGLVKFNSTRAEFTLIVDIAARARRAAQKVNVDYPECDAHMDIEATHCNGNPLRLQELYEASDAHFNHDVMGIRKFIDRDTGKLMGGFTPRYSK